MPNCFFGKQHSLKRYKLFFILSIVVTSGIALADKSTKQTRHNDVNSDQALPTQNSREQIGNSYFDTHPVKPNRLPPKTISQVGLAADEHQTNVAAYVFINQLFTNNIFYELRAYTIYNYISRTPPAPPLVPEVIPVSSVQHPKGYGGIGILGYNIVINPNVSVMPFIRLQAMKNAIAAYQDSFGNEIDSADYTALLGTKVSMRVNQEFAIYTQYFAGYQSSFLNGRGIYSNSGHPTINAFTSVLEFGLPYKITKKLSITPYLQFITAGPNPNQAARNQPYNMGELARTNTIYAIKIGYDI
jgi:hypothetical protein